MWPFKKKEPEPQEIEKRTTYFSSPHLFRTDPGIPQAAAVPGATVRLISETRGTHVPEVTAGADGQFVVPDVPPDTYTLQISSKGFETFQRTALQVGPGDRVALGPLALVVGAISQTVTVSSETPLLQTESAERSATVTSTEVQNLPLPTDPGSSAQLAKIASLPREADGSVTIPAIDPEPRRFVVKQAVIKPTPELFHRAVLHLPNGEKWALIHGGEVAAPDADVCEYIGRFWYKIPADVKEAHAE